MGFMRIYQSVAQYLTNQLKKNKIPFLLNFLVIFPFALLTAYIKVSTLVNGYSSAGRTLRRRAGLEFLEALFEEPYNSVVYEGMLTEMSEILWCFPIAICFFSRNLLPNLAPYRDTRRYLLRLGALLITLLLDDVFRLTLLLNFYIGWPKILSYVLYGCLACLIAFRYWRTITQTPYIFLVLSVIFLLTSSAVEFLPVRGIGTPILLEDGSKLLGLLNLSIYVWRTCQKRILLIS